MDSTYAPQSPDLSSFFTSPSKTQQPYHPQITSNSTSYTPQSPTIPSFNNPAIQQQPPTSTYNHSAQTTQDGSSLYSQQPHHSFTNSFGGQSQTHNSLGGGSTIGPSYDHFDTSNTQYQIPDLPPQHSFPKQHEPQHYYAPPPQPYSESPQSYTHPSQPSYLRSEDSGFSTSSLDNPYIPAPISHSNQASSIMSRRTGKQAPYETEFQQIPSQPQAPLLKDPNPTNIQISTKFPTARIKRIMQADEEVGKVAQVTPPAVNKALELFMIALVTGAAEKAKEKGGKRITAQHLKQVVLGDEQFDFLAEIVGRVEEGKEEGGGPGRKRKTKKEDGSESSDEAGDKKKKGKGGRKKKNADE